MKRPLIEACVDSYASAMAASRAGADRLELCAHLVIGGTTPTHALFRQVQRGSGVPINVLIRPRFGDFLYTEPELEEMCEEIAAFRDLGANGVVIAEPVAGLLSPALSAEFSGPYVKQIVDAVQDDSFLVIYHNCGNSTIQMIDSILETGSAAYHFGNAIDMAEMMTHIPAGTVAMGNVDPAGEFRNGTPESIRAATLGVMDACCKYPNFVISSGCDIPPLSRWENIDAFFAAVNEFYAGTAAGRG